MQVGSLRVITGCMFSGKSSELLRRYTRHQIGGKKCLLVKPKKDNRFSENSVVTHDNKKVKCIVLSKLKELNDEIKNYDVICIDEIQFFEDADYVCDRWAFEGKIIEVSGLNGTFNRTPWEVMSKLFALADDIVFMKAVCKKTGNDAVFSYLSNKHDENKENEPQIVIGGRDKYEAVDRTTLKELIN